MYFCCLSLDHRSESDHLISDFFISILEDIFATLYLRTSNQAGEKPVNHLKSDS